MAEPHDDIHTRASQASPEDGDALSDGTGQESMDEKLAKLDQRLTKRINDLRKDADTTAQATSKSVRGFQDDLAKIKTDAENNAASIESFNSSLTIASKKAADAHTAADSAHQAADGAHKASQAAVEKADQVDGHVTALRGEYEVHQHGLPQATSGPQPPAS